MLGLNQWKLALASSAEVAKKLTRPSRDLDIVAYGTLSSAARIQMPPLTAL